MKIPDNLAEMYSTLTAKSPEMVVDGLAWMQDPSGCITLWNRSNEGIDWRRLRHDEASALIRSHWEDELPDGRWLDKAQDEPHRATYSICSASWNEDEDSLVIGDYVPRFDDPITALYHYHMGRGA